MMKVRILQHNCARSTNVMHTLLNIAEKNADIIIIQESWISRDGETISHHSFNTYIAKNDQYQARTAIFVTKVHAHFKTTIRNDIINDSDVQIIDISTNEDTFRMYNVYNERQEGIYTFERTLQTHSFERNVKIIFAGDFQRTSRMVELKYQQFNAKRSESRG